MSITPAQVAEWRRVIREEGALHSALAQRIAPRLLEEIERAWAEIERVRRKVAVQENAAPERRLVEVPSASAASMLATARRRRST